MDSSILSAKDRQQLEEVLDQFDRALKACRDGRLPDVEPYLAAYEGKERNYLQREIESLVDDSVRGEYVKLRRIGGGGMGDVYLARHIVLGRHFALKEIKLECMQHGDRKEFENRFQREVEACGRLEHHPNIVSVTNTGSTSAGVPYLVMEYIDGVDLKQLVERHGPLSIPHACRIIHDAAVGLAHAHEKGLVHRDIKPPNLMVSKHGMVTVLDLGLARVIESDRHQTFVSMPGLVGSFDYMSPEQCREEHDVDVRADVYSLGCTFYFLLAGRPPYFEQRSIFQKLNAHQQDEAPPIDRLAEFPALEQILRKMIAKRPEDRYENLRLVARDLRPFSESANLAELVEGETPALSGSSFSGDDVDSTRPYFQTSSATYAGGATIAQRKRFNRRAFLTATASALATAGVGISLGYKFWPSGDAWAPFLVTLPGLNGRWWFEETPWFLPDVRVQLSQSLGSAAAAELYEAAKSADTPKFYRSLQTAALDSQGAWPAAAQESLQALLKHDPETLDNESIVSSLRELQRRVIRVDEPSRAAADWHLLAIIEHHIGESFPAATDAYEKALAGYAGRPSERAACLSDWGHMFLKQRQFNLAATKFSYSRQQLTGMDDKPDAPASLFRLHSLSMEADAHRSFENWGPAVDCLLEATALLDSLAAEHPLRAVFHERSAWYHLDAWRLAKAQDEFRQAKTIRDANHAAQNHRALHFIYWDRQGKAMVDFYQNEVERSRVELEAMLADIRAVDMAPKQSEELRSRRPNLCERAADAYMVESRFDDAARMLGNAIAFAVEEGFVGGARRGIWLRLQYKQALLLALAGKMAEAQSRKDVVDQLADVSPASDVPQSSRRKATKPPAYNLTRELVEAQLSLDGDQHGGERILHRLSSSTTATGRDDLLLLLVVARSAVASERWTDEEKTKIRAEITRLADVRATDKRPAVDNSESDGVERPQLFQVFAGV